MNMGELIKVRSVIELNIRNICSYVDFLKALMVKLKFAPVLSISSLILLSTTPAVVVFIARSAICKFIKLLSRNFRM